MHRSTLQVQILLFTSHLLLVCFDFDLVPAAFCLSEDRPLFPPGLLYLVHLLCTLGWC